MKLKLIALAAVLAASGAANAAIDNGQTTGDGSLLANVSYGNAALGQSATFDLGITFSQVATWNSSIASSVTAGQSWSRSWDLTTGVLSGTGLTASTVGNYGSVFSNFTAAATAAGATATSQLNLFAFDNVGTAPGDNAIYVTGNFINNTTGAAALPTAAQTPNNSVYNSVQPGTTVQNFLANVNVSGTHATDANGANNAANGSMAYFNNGTGMEKLAQTAFFDTNGQYNGQYAAGTTTFAGQDKALPFYMVTASGTSGTAKASLSAIGYDFDADGIIEYDNNGVATVGGANEFGLWTLQNNALTFSVAAVPEPETYAMLLAGLGLMGAIARRRNKGA